MQKSLKRKWTGAMMLLVLSVLVIVSVFLLSATVNYYINQFRSEVGAVFTTQFLEELNGDASGTTETAASQIATAVEAYSGALGIGSGREYYILNAETGECLASSKVGFDGTVNRTANIVKAMNGEVGEDISLFGRTMDLAIPVSGESKFVVDIQDNRVEMQHMCWLMFLVILAALLLGLIASAALSLVLMRTVTDPIAELSRGAKRIAGGDYEQYLLVHDPDEIGELTNSFNEMSAALRRSMAIAKLEHARMQLLSGYIQEGTLSFSASGEVFAMNAAAENLLGKKFQVGIRYADLFPELPFPDAAKGAEQMTFHANGVPLRVVFAADEKRGFAAVVCPEEARA